MALKGAQCVPLCQQQVHCMLLCQVKQVLIGRPQVKGDDLHDLNRTANTVGMAFADVAAKQSLQRYTQEQDLTSSI